MSSQLSPGAKRAVGFHGLGAARQDDPEKYPTPEPVEPNERSADGTPKGISTFNGIPTEEPAEDDE
jgi:hypothetical protein